MTLAEFRNRTLSLFLPLALTGCLAAAAAGAGGAIVLSGHTAEAIVERSVDDMVSAAEAVLSDEGIDVTDTRSENSGERRVLEGDKGDLDITVRVERADEGTKVGVSARRNAAQWDDDYARSLLANIIE